MAVIEFRTLGTLDLRRADGSELHSLLAQPKRVALLTYLCVASPRGFHRRDTLLGLFWPNVDQTHARTSLRNALHVLRHSLGENAFHSRGDEEVAVNFDVIWCDAVTFDERVASHDVDGGLDLYRGDFLTGFFLDDVPSFERWVESERTRLRASAAQAARVAAERHEAERDLTEAVSLARRAVDLAATDERAVRGLIELLARVGDRAGALHAYENFAQHLAAEFGAEPSTETRALLAHLRSNDQRPGSVRDSRATKTVDVTPANVFVDAPRSPPARVSRARLWRGLVAVTTIGVIAFAWWKVRPQPAGHELRARLTDRALITNTGRVSHSAISPNGKTLAYVTTECRTAGCAYALELKEVDGSASRRIVDGLGELPPNCLQWGPDGSKILVNGRIGDQVGTFLVSALGGVPRRLGPGRFSFWADGDSLLSAGNAPGDTLWILVSGLDGVPRDSIPLTGITHLSPTDGITRILPIPKSAWIAVAISRGIRTQWISIDRSGHIGDTLGIRPGGPPRVSEDALWLGLPSSESALRSVVRIPFDARRGRFVARQDTMFTGNWTAFDVTADGGTFVYDEGASEFSGWALEMSDVVRGVFPEKRRLLTATSDLIFEIAPDGKKILVGRAAGPRPDGGRRWDILPFDGGAMAPLAATPSAHTAMLWSDSKTIPVLAPTSRGTELALLDVNTGVRRATYVAADSTMAEATSLAESGWVWLPWAAREIKLHRRGDAVARTLPFPPKHGHVESLAASPDGTKLLLVTTRPASRDTIRLNVMSLSDGRIANINSWFGGAAFAVWLADGSIMLAVWRLPDSGLTLYRLRETGETIWSATIPHPVWSISVSADMKRTALTVREYHGDASISRVIRE